MKTLFRSLEDVTEPHRRLPMGNVGQVNVNLAGREPHGCVAPGEEYERVRDDIIARLWQLRDPETGEQVVEAVYRREELYTGEQADRAADIVFIPRRMEYFGFGEYEFGSHRTIDPVRHGISGTHRLDGIFMAIGRGIRPGARIEDARIIDLAPTIMHLMGEPVPAHMDGRVLEAAISEGFQPETAPREREEWHREPDDGDGSQGGLTRMRAGPAERLRNPGYGTSAPNGIQAPLRPEEWFQGLTSTNPGWICGPGWQPGGAIHPGLAGAAGRPPSTPPSSQLGAVAGYFRAYPPGGRRRPRSPSTATTTSSSRMSPAELSPSSIGDWKRSSGRPRRAGHRAPYFSINGTTPGLRHPT